MIHLCALLCSLRVMSAARYFFSTLQSGRTGGARNHASRVSISHASYLHHSPKVTRIRSAPSGGLGLLTRKMASR